MSDTRKGYVSIHREIMEHWIWQDKPVSKGQAWVDLILLANYKTEKFPFKNMVVEGKRGTIYRSITQLGERWGWSRNKVKRFLEMLESDGMVSVNATTHGTTVFIQNYENYQGFQCSPIMKVKQPKDNKKADDGQQAVNYSAASVQQLGTYNKENHSNNDNKGNHSVQTPEEIEEASRWFDSL